MKWVGWIFSLAGLVVMGFGLNMLAGTQRFVADAETTSGTVIELLRSRDSDGDVTYRPLVVYETAAGAKVEFASSLSARPAAYEVGESVTVLYQPDRPRQARLKDRFSIWGPSILLSGFGLVFLAIGATTSLWPLWRAHRARRLRQRGDRVLATWERVALDTSIAYNGRHPWRVHAHWTDPLTGQRHAFRSDRLWEDPNGRWEGRGIPVYIERGRPTHYAMDLSETAPFAGVV